MLVCTNWTTFCLETFLQDSYINRIKMMYNWHLITHRYFVCAKLMFSKAVLCYFSLMAQHLLKKLFSRTYNNSEKMMYNWLLMTHIYVMWARLTFSEAVLCWFWLIEQLFVKKLFSRTCTLRDKKLCTIDLWWLIYMLCEQNWCFLKQFCVSFH